ncbi:HupE/UreJ family protein [Agarivorans sp. MS3-6]|uniref:HupE/UreJ family protein n=1 Tax=Agarivorans sp. TSD2052 TaxID=2937286 RepID=UPI00200FA460|nr:HupE/UreJ family protein [Agarivorans sp. TSD2052]UPW18444.1 HupE/UreJ family protein [Agarivorans sp. TSD2052]
MKKLLTLTAGLLFSLPGFAHEGAHHGLSAGLLHPLTGIDHLLALSLIGLLASQTGKLKLSLSQSLFALVLAALVASFGLVPPMLETGLAVSLLVMAVLVAKLLPRSAGIAGLVVCLVAALHGAAHGNEVPAGADLTLFFAGFIASSVTLICGGYLLGKAALRSQHGLTITRAIAGLTAAFGLSALLA